MVPAEHGAVIFPDIHFGDRSEDWTVSGLAASPNDPTLHMAQAKQIR